MSRRYTEQQRAEALELFVELGAGETARRLGIPKPTVASWARRAGVHTDAEAASRARARTEAARARWEEVSEERRQQLAARLLAEVHGVLDTLSGPVLHRQVVTLAGGTGEPATAEVVDVVLPAPTGRDLRDRSQAATLLMREMRELLGQAGDAVDDDVDLIADMRQIVNEKQELQQLRLRLVDDTGT